MEDSEPAPRHCVSKIFQSAWASSPIMLMEAQASIRVDTSPRAFALTLATLRLALARPITNPFENERS
jgi:hypothetical protein